MSETSVFKKEIEQLRKKVQENLFLKKKYDRHSKHTVLQYLEYNTLNEVLY